MEALEQTETTEAPIEAEVTEGAEQQQEAQEQPQQQDNKPPGYHPIDFKTATPEEVEQRHNYLYKQIKDNKRTEKTLREYKQIAEAQSRQIENLTQGFTGVVTHLQDKSFNETELTLTQKMQAAYEAGDSANFVDAQNKLISLKAEKLATERDRKAAPPPKQEQQRYAASAVDVAAENDLSPEDNSYVQSWQQETDDTGNTLRPWSVNRSADPNNPDADFIIANMQLKKITQEPRFANATVQQALQELDRRMGVSKPAARQNVMGGNLTVTRKTTKIALNPKQEEIAVRMKLGGPKASRDQHIQAYYKAQLEETQQRARK